MYGALLYYAEEENWSGLELTEAVKKRAFKGSFFLFRKRQSLLDV